MWRWIMNNLFSTSEDYMQPMFCCFGNHNGEAPMAQMKWYCWVSTNVIDWIDEDLVESALSIAWNMKDLYYLQNNWNIVIAATRSWMN
jgi:hypothetical protein